MATHALPSSHILGGEETPSMTTPTRTRRVLRRIYDALIEAQMRRAQREIDMKLGTGALARAFRAELPPER